MMSKHKLLIIFVLIIFFSGGLALNISISESAKIQRHADKVEEILYAKNRVLGQSCGILSHPTAERLLDTNNLNIRVTNGPLNNVVQSGDNNLHWSDSCKYESNTNNQIYLEFSVQTYANQESATVNYRYQLPKVGDVESQQSDVFTELKYSAGVWYAREDTKIVTVAAGIASPSESKNFSEKAFIELTNEL